MVTKPTLWPILLAAALAAPGVAPAAAADGTPATRDAPPPGEYTVSPESSWIRILMFRGGLLGRLGHNHVVSASRIDGSVVVGDPPTDSDIELGIPYSALEVDEAAAREAAGDRFPGTVPADDVAGTRANMLGPKLLAAGDYDGIELHSTDIRAGESGWTVSFDVALRGATHRLDFPVDVEVIGDTIRASGERELTHAELGLLPFTAALGTLRVKEKMTVVYSIVAVR